MLVGGASQMPLVQRRIAVRLLANYRSKLRSEHHCRAGAAIQAACRLRSEDIEEVILTDICPYSFGIEVNRRAFATFFADY
ncbi:Hsp70 family protein [Escherichia coli]